jgi:hypothetical protein
MREIDEQQSINNTNGIDGNITVNMNRRVRGKEETQVKISIRDFGWEEARLS